MKKIVKKTPMKKGGTVKKAFLGSLLGGLGSNLLGGAIGGMMGGGGGGGASSTALQNNNAKLNMPNLGGSMKKGGKVVAKKKAKTGTSLGMKSVKAGVDKNPGVTRADIITAATKKARSGTIVKKAQNGAKTADSTAYFNKEKDFRFKEALTDAKFGFRKSADAEMKKGMEAGNNASRQGLKGMPGYDKNGYPVKKKKAQDGDSIKKPSVRMTSTKNYDVKETTYPRGDKETTTKFNPRGGAKFNIPPITKKKAKSGTTVKKCRYGCK